MVFFTQITMEAAEDPDVPRRHAQGPHQGALVGVEVGHRRRAEGRLQGLQPRRRRAGRAAARLPPSRRARARLVHLRAAERSRATPSTRRWRWRRRPTSRSRSSCCSRRSRARSTSRSGRPIRSNQDDKVDGISVTQHWLIPQHKRPKLYTPHPTMSIEEIRVRTQGAWDQLLQLGQRLGAGQRRQEHASHASRSC